VVTGADDDDFTAESVRAGMQHLMIGFAIALSLGFVWCYCFFKSHPPTPPSQSAFERLQNRNKRLHISHATHSQVDAKDGLEDEEVEEDGMQESVAEVFHELIKNFKVLLTNGSFLLLLVGFSIGLAIFNALLTLIAQWLNPYGYSNDEVYLYDDDKC
jgi:Na+/melibiose symporter-like transporter